jgi:peptide/nickel transport system ATP-binding protein
VTAPLLDVRDLSVGYATARGIVRAVRGLSVTVRAGEVVGLIGESGSGKTSAAYAIMGHLPANGRIVTGAIWFDGVDLAAAPARAVRALWGRRIAMVFQNPATSLNPSFPIGDQLTETLRAHARLGRAGAWTQAAEWLDRVGLPDPERLMRRYPHQLSGGEKQRALIAMAFSCRPRLLLLDEPTTALDATTAAGIMDLLERLTTETQTAALFITHHLDTMARIARRVVVMYAGTVVESGPTAHVLEAPAHPYTRALVAAVPAPVGPPRRLPSLPGTLPDLVQPPAGCIFQARCPFVDDACRAAVIPLERAGDRAVACVRLRDIQEQPVAAEPLSRRDAGTPLLDVQSLRVAYPAGPQTPGLLPWRRPPAVQAVDGVTAGVAVGETLGLVGESGCGKSTLARALVGLQEFQGRVALEDTVLSGRPVKVPAAYRRDVRLIFQHPDASLNPRKRVRDILGRPLRLYGLAPTRREQDLRAGELLQKVRLPKAYLDRYPHELSGGEKQRVAIARAFAGRPRLVICDEVTSGLDVSVQAAIVNLLLDLQAESGTSLIFISHDLNLVRTVADRVAVMYLGRIVETGAAGRVYEPPFHPYTEALLAAAPIPDPAVGVRRVRLTGPLPSPAQPPRGCRFHTRCHRKLGAVCEDVDPPTQVVAPGHGIACLIPAEDLRRVPPVWRPKHPEETTNEEVLQ